MEIKNIIILPKNIDTILKEAEKGMENGLVFPFEDAVLRFEGDAQNRVVELQVKRVNEAFTIAFFDGEKNVTLEFFDKHIQVDKNGTGADPSNNYYTAKGIRRSFSDIDERLSQYCVSACDLVMRIYSYIATHHSEPEEVREAKLKNKSKKRKGSKRQSVKYITTRKYILTGTEKRTRGKAIYTTPEWGVRGFYRNLKSGKRIWIKPQTRKRKGVIKDAREQHESIYKIT